MNFLFLLLSVVLIVPLIVALIIFLIRRLCISPMPAFSSFIVDSKFRKGIQPAKKIIEIAEIRKGMTILDMGCGPGSYSLDFSRAVGDKGQLYAVDVQPKMIEKLEKKLNQPENKNIKNIKTKIADAYDLPFSDQYFDMVCMVGVLPEIPDRIRALKEIKRVLKDAGSLVISEVIIDPDYPLKRTTLKWCGISGFKLEESWSNLFSYTFQFKKE